MITTYQDFIENYLVFDGMLANAENVNKSADQLKKELMEVISNLGALSNSAQVLDLNDSISINGKVITIKKGDGSTESISVDLFDTVVKRIASVDNRVPKFDGTNGDLSLTALSIDDSDNLTVPGSITSNIGVLNGNSSTATKLKTPRTIALTGGLTASGTFDGSANLTLNSTITNNGHTHVSANITDATEINTANVLVKRDSNGNFAASTITANLSGNATTATTATTTTGNAGTATKLQTPRTITLSGVLSGSTTFDGSANVTITAAHTADPTITLTGSVTGSGTLYDLGNVAIATTVANDSHTHDTRYYTETESDSRFLKLTGGTISSNLTVSGVVNADGGLIQDGFTILNGTDTWIRTQGATGWYNATYSGGMYMADSTWVRTYGGKGLLTDSELYVGGSGTINGSLTVGNGQGASTLNMYDSDEGTRQLHCNSNRIGFLNQSGGWGSYCTDDGSFASDFSMSAPNFYGGRFTGNSVGNDYSSGGFETRGNGTANTIFPTIGFHQPGLYASSLQLRGASEFIFYAQGAGSYANVSANLFRGTATSARYADLAEKYLTDKEYEVGTVLEFGGEKELTLYNGGTLAGVISDKPGFILNEESEGQLVALKGKTPVKCNSIITRGQYCVAVGDGIVKGYNKKDMTFDLTLDLVGIALEDSKDNLVMVKI